MESPTPAPSRCERCLKESPLCVCAELPSIETRVHVLILQHPQEPDKDLGTARLAHLALPNSTLRIGLSWPNLAKALGRTVTPSRWAVLYLGSGAKAGATHSGSRKASPLQLVTRQGEPENPGSDLSDEIEGVVILDGTWSQAKALWWRNPWMLKLRRAILTPSSPSLYKELRREPRKECLSTIESIAETLVALGEPSSTGEQLKLLFSKLLDKQRARPRPPGGRPRVDWRRRRPRQR